MMSILQRPFLDQAKLYNALLNLIDGTTLLNLYSSIAQSIFSLFFSL